MSKPGPINGVAAASLRTVANPADDSPDALGATVRVMALECHAGTAADGADATRAAESAVPTLGSEDERVDWEERAAIAEFEGRLTRHQAERLAVTRTAAHQPEDGNRAKS